MARQLRIEYPGAFYHITSRGNQKQAIYLTDRDRAAFLDIVGEAHDKFSAMIHAYCLMINHFHLMLETPLGNLSRIMHFINTSYTIYFNKKHSRVGHLFQGRFKAILVEADAYALELSRYIHLNPVRAKIVSVPEHFPWSSYREYMDTTLKLDTTWLKKDLVLGHFGRNPMEARIRYVEYVNEAVGRDIANPFSKTDAGFILGSEDFIARIKTNHLQDKPENREIPAIRGLRDKPTLENIQCAAAHVYAGDAKFARNVAIYLCCKNTDYCLGEIAKFYRVGKSTVGKIAIQMKTLVAVDKNLDRVVKKIETTVFSNKWKV
ncbi:MAG: hypothetical protein A2Y86_08565 [Candidatus Aminicenantes bacterium RBG_13_62_12]|nr:MAG: hypothetical protein A2Y86_08565 [Candidatus Aminicenantes bacterium RBG_13_62_12]